MPQFHGNISGQHVHGDGNVPTGVPTIGTIVSGDTTLTIPYTGPVTHYRVYEIGSAAPAWISAPPSPIVFTGASNTEYQVEVSGDGSTVADSEQAGTNNPGTGGGEFLLTGGGSAVVSVTASGAGTADVAASGGGSAVVSVTASGAGSAGEVASGGGSAFVNVTAAGAGSASSATESGGSAVVAVLARGDGIGSIAFSSGGQVLVRVTARGAGTSVTPEDTAYPLAGLSQPYPLAGLTQT